MTTQQKSKINYWLEFIPKAITPALLIALIWGSGEFKGEIKSLIFSSVESKVNTENHTKNILSEFELRELKHHVNNPNFHMSKVVKDSSYVTRKEFNDLIKLDAVTNFQTKTAIEGIGQKLFEINKKLD